ncbi:MAG: anhydro-N-acetylmuramic acid kinase [Alphaproteobacteria bacterium]|nr:anhydro-N-acetylmuramic acid kinase [Alphaproteobacteria bacterium]
MIKALNVLALMCSGALKSVKCALVSTDGVDIYQTYLKKRFVLPDDLRVQIVSVMGKNVALLNEKTLIDAADDNLTAFLIDIIEEIKNQTPVKIDLLGIEGPTIALDAAQKYTYQLGRGRQIFEHFALPTATHFHNSDILHGGQGAPLTATYYQALALKLIKPTLFIDIGGVTTLTFIGTLGQICAFDAAPGNALLDRFMQKHAGVDIDYNGKSAALGTPDFKIVANLMRCDFFEKKPPKALVRDAFKNKEEHFEGLSVKDGAATIVEFIAEAVDLSVKTLLPEKPASTVICGGGAQNPTLVRAIRQKLKNENIKTEDILPRFLPDDGEAFAFLAARTFYALPITFPSTTGVATPLSGGKLYSKEI